MRLSLNILRRMPTDVPNAQPDIEPPSQQDSPPPTIDTQSLFGGRSEIRLLHQGVEYRLRITKLGKLILTK